ncbi:protein ESSENTIAL FOR POTEXVIRUS ACCUMULATION 1-like isoform X2 [Phragmites australis]|uniref:protein ESSENTIAL FOR POTEXVIRUS ACCUMULATION 1-like isoform X2 n=1 Tax=Phragmites australis TaxID=29695 RepID=UPI002D79D85C|nr:protein ESSENTIAL FOR POTEXVIRUS ACCUMULATION 1-like isoform X2 [Phragmites australis]
MAERKLDRPAALGKDGLSLGIEEDRAAAAAAMGFVDDFKDPQHLENSIPLSPQWLYAKPTDAKISLPHGSSLEPAEKELRLLEGTVDKKERRRNVFDADSGLRWLEEERETSLLGRKERKKEVDRDLENRKNDRRSDNVSARDNIDSRAPPTSERWSDGSTRSLGNEARRDGKWSSRWGPDDKEKDSRSDKKIDAEKDETYAEKQTFTGRLLSESDSRDKWRPRHRQESHSVGTATYRAAPGFGSEKGRVKDSNVGFAPGRGRGNPNLVPSFNRPSSAGPIGAPPVHGKCAKTAVTFRYPRGKLLDIYRQKNMMASFDDAHLKLEEIPSITLSTSAKPLAFVAPNTLEEALLEDIRKGKIISSEAINAPGNKKERTQDPEEPACGVDDNKAKTTIAFGGLGHEGSALISEKDAFYDEGMFSSAVSTSAPMRFIEEHARDNQSGIPGIHEGLKTDEVKSSADHDLSTKLPDDSNTLFDVPPFEHPPESTMSYQSSDMDMKARGQVSYPEELTLYYLDPQGGVQGPFLGADIISWYEDGYFGLELPVRLSQAPDDAPFRPLVEVMPHLGRKPQSHPPVPCDESAGSLDSVQSKFEAAIPTSASSGKSDQASKWDSESYAVDPKRGEQEASVQSQTSWLPSSETQKDSANIRQHIPEAVNQDAEVLYTGRPNSSMGQSLRDLENDRADFQLASRDPRSRVGEANLPQHDGPRESDLSPLGLLWSELEGMHPKQPLSSNVLGVNKRRNPKPTAPKDIPAVNMRHGPLSRMNEASGVRDEWPANFGQLDNMNDANISGRIPQVEAEHHLNFEEQLLLQQIRREQLQQEQMMARNNLEFPGPFPGQVFDSLHQHRQPMNQPLPDADHILRVQFELEQQRCQQLQQEQHQRQLQQQRQTQLLQQQQQQQQKMILEQLLQQQLQGSNFGPNNMVDQVLLREHVLNDLHHQPHHLQRQHDAAIEQLIQAKFGHGLHREHHNDMLDVLPRSNQRQMLPLEQQILLGLQHEQLQSQQLANALRQHSGREEERHLSGVWPMDDAGQFICSGTSPNQGHISRQGRFDLLDTLQRSSSFEHHEHLDRSLSLHERLHRGGQGIHSLERSGSLPGGGPLPNPDVINALARQHGLGQLETHGDFYSSGQMPMLASGVHPQQHRFQEQLSGSHAGRLERHWLDANGQLQNSLMESSRINQLQIEAEKQRRNVEMNLSVDNPHAWAALMNKERNTEQDLSDMIRNKLVLQSQQSLGFPDVPVPASFGRKDPSVHFAQPVAENPLRSPVNRLTLEESLAERSVFTKIGESAQEGSVNLNSIENSGKYNLRSNSSSMLEQKHFLATDDVQRGEFSDITGGRASANQFVGSVNELTRGKKQGSSVNLAGDDTDFAEEAVRSWSDTGISKGNSHSLLKRTTSQHTATSQAVSMDLSSTVRLKKAGLSSSDENKMESVVTSVAKAMEASVPSSKETGAYSMQSTTTNLDASGQSFSEALKSTKKPPMQYDASESADGGPGGKGAKKKTKKGKQIDPSLLGFKVHSNRIMMGEIVRDD